MGTAFRFRKMELAGEGGSGQCEPADGSEPCPEKRLQCYVHVLLDQFLKQLTVSRVESFVRRLVQSL